MTRCAHNRTERRRLRRKLLRRIREDQRAFRADVIVQYRPEARTLVIRSGVPDHIIIDAPVESIWFDGYGNIVR